jgi:hypothetical protein
MRSEGQRSELDRFEDCDSQEPRAPSFRLFSGERVGNHEADWRPFNTSISGPADQPRSKKSKWNCAAISLERSACR